MPSPEEIRRLIGDPKELEAETRRFECSARLLGQSVELAEKYDGQWLAAYDGAVVAIAPTFEALMKAVDEKRIPRGETAFRRMKKPPPRTRIR
jgi:hypothetical protein